MSRAMKDSGIPWIGAIPEAWEVRSFRYFSTLQNGISAGANFFQSGTPFVNYSDVYNNALLPQTVSGVAASSQMQQDFYSVRKGDVFFTRTSETVEELAMASVCTKTIPQAVFSGFLIRARLNRFNINLIYSKYYFRSSVTREHFIQNSNLVTRASLSQELLKKLPIILPSLHEQQAIADYLDRKTQQIDATVEREKQHIEKLKQYRQSLISETVTKGLDPTAPLRDSGIPWIGQIPENWKVKRLKHLATLNPSCDLPIAEESDHVTFLPMENLKQGYFLPREIKLSSYNNSYNRFKNNDIVLAKVTPCFENGNIAIMQNLKNNFGFGSSELFVIRAVNITNTFLMYYLQTNFFQQGGIQSMTGAGGLKRVSSTFVKNVQISLPSLHEQKAITDYLDRKTAQIDAVLTQKETLISKLLEYKKSLIYEAVTGKLLVEHNNE